MTRFTPILALTLFLAPACTATKTEIINRTSVGLTAARAAFTEEDERLQMQAVTTATSRMEADAALAKHREKRSAVTKAFQGAWAALAVASMDPSDVNIAKLVQLSAEAVTAMQGGISP